MAESDTGLAFKPPHPGEVIKEDMLPELGMTVGQLAEHLGVKRAALSNLINQKSGVSLEMAIRLGKAFRNGARFWLALQMQYELWKAEQESKIEVEPLDWRDGEFA